MEGNAEHGTIKPAHARLFFHSFDFILVSVRLLKAGERDCGGDRERSGREGTHELRWLET